MKEKILVKMGAVLIFLGFLGITPVMAAFDPGFPAQPMGLPGQTDLFNSGSLSVFSEPGAPNPGFTSHSTGLPGQTDLFNSGSLSVLSELGALNPGFTSHSMGLPRQTDLFNSGGLSALSQSGDNSPFGKIASPSEIEWNPAFMYNSYRNAHRFPRCRLG